MRSGCLANTWSSYDSGEMCRWTASFPHALGASFLPPWQDAILSAAEETGIFRVEAISGIGYRRERDGSLAVFIRVHPQAAPATDDWPTGSILQDFDVLPAADAATLLSYADPQGQIAEAWVHEMYEFAAPLGLRNAFEYRPFNIAQDTFEASPTEMGVVLTGFYLSTDIWLPWATDSSYCGPGERGYGILDNRILGRINGARLNAFLNRVRDAAIRLGGDWAFRTGAPIFEAQVDENGIILDAPRPGAPAEI